MQSPILIINSGLIGFLKFETKGPSEILTVILTTKNWITIGKGSTNIHWLSLFFWVRSTYQARVISHWIQVVFELREWPAEVITSLKGQNSGLRQTWTSQCIPFDSVHFHPISDTYSGPMLHGKIAICWYCKQALDKTKWQNSSTSPSIICISTPEIGAVLVCLVQDWDSEAPGTC